MAIRILFQWKYSIYKLSFFDENDNRFDLFFAIGESLIGSCTFDCADDFKVRHPDERMLRRTLRHTGKTKKIANRQVKDPNFTK